jgi:hypothetical protein
LNNFTFRPNPVHGISAAIFSDTGTVHSTALWLPMLLLIKLLRQHAVDISVCGAFQTSESETNSNNNTSSRCATRCESATVSQRPVKKTADLLD